MPQHFRTDYVNFIVADFKGIYHAILGRLGIAKFMAVPHYQYLVLKMPTEKGILSLRGNVHMASSCENKAYDTAKIFDLRARLDQTCLEAKQLTPAELEIPTKQAKRASEKCKTYKQVELIPSDKSKTARVGIDLNPK